MPPRKSNLSTTTAADAAAGDVSMVSNATATSPAQQHAHPKQSRQSGGGGKQDDGIGIDDLLLPRSLVSRLSRGVLPANTSLQKDALLALTRSATVFISYLAHHANEQSQLRHRKTLGVQDVYTALREMELAGVMEVGVIGTDGRQGGRLEREVALFEEGVMRKRKGYREKVKARESNSAGGDGREEEDRGEPSSKKIRRLSEDDEEEERMLEQQLNGTAGDHDEEAQNDKGKGKGKRKSSDAGGISVVVQNGHSKGKEEAALPAAADGQDEDEDADEAEEVEDDPAGDEEDEDQDQDDEADEDSEDESEDDEAEADADNDEVDDSRHTNGGSRGLLPNGEVDVGSDEESD